MIETFFIGFRQNQDRQSGEFTQKGYIKINDFEESFIADVSYWSPQQYQNQWRQAIRLISENKVNKAALITSIPNLVGANFLVWWPLYRVGGRVFVQNHMLFLQELPAPFDPTDPYKFVRPRQTDNEDGEKISEWLVSIEALKSFLAEFDYSQKNKLDTR